MKTMFLSHEKINSKKKFQKPNILRKKPKISSIKSFETPDKNDLVSKEEKDKAIQKETYSKLTSISLLPNIVQPAMHPRKEVFFGSEEVINIPHDQINQCARDNDLANGGNLEMKSDENSNQGLVNIEAFFNDAPEENVMLYDIDFEPGKQIETLVVIGNESTGGGMYIDKKSDIISNLAPLSAITSPLQEESTVVNSSSGNVFTIPSSKFKCDAPNCKKEFRSKLKLEKHKNIHNEDGSIKAPRQITVECPVKKVEADGTERPCGKIFLIRDLLLQHLDEEHTLEDAAYSCEECGRRFFWASGLRAHARSHCRRGGVLMCAWAGCGRVFRQPCRLREHARSHTGDRPYPCHYPNCGWSFRSASKLVRHARRHTGERRHACAACGRAFLRREHLRDHHARHHVAPRRPRPCTHPGCEQSFNNMSTLYMHMKRVHKNEKTMTSETATSETPIISVPKIDTETTFLVNITPESPPIEPILVEGHLTECIEDVVTEDEEEWHSARTHCTWPLPRINNEFVEDSTVLEEDNVEQSEASENNIYTVRSDLFLHGNVLINEDSEHMAATGVENGANTAAAEGTACGDSLDADLGLLDAHPTIDLMQEELMYTDVAADESSFRIFLLSGEELT